MLAAAVITCVLVVLLGEGRTIFQSRYTIFLRFPQAPGVTVDTPVRKHGVLIGRVSDVKLLDEGGVLLTVWIESIYKLRRNEVCRISTSSLLGDAVLEFVPRSTQGVSSNEPIREGDLLADGVVASDPLKVLTNLEGNMQGTIDAIESAANEVSQLARNINNSLGSDQGQFQRIVAKSELALDTIHKTMSTVDDVLGDPELKDGLKRSLKDLPGVFQDIRTTMTQANQTMADFREVSQKAGRNLDNLENFTRPLSERGEALVQNVDQTLNNLDELLSQLVTFSRSMNSQEGTLGRLVHDREIYDKLQRATGNIEDATRRIRPILDDVRVFTDKIATDPRQLGVKGAMDGKPIGLGFKSGFGESLR